MSDPFAALDALLRVRLAHLPTPIEPLPRLSAHLGGAELWVKRDDQTGLATGGNKTRKLEYLIAQAQQAGADCVITAGAAQSNHARQTAAAGAKVGLEAHLVLHALPSEPPVPIGNLLIDRLVGAVIHWTDEGAPYAQTIARVAEELRAAGKRPYVIPYGGSNAWGLLGYVQAMREFAEQAREVGHFDAHVFATSSGGTQAGLVLGAHLAALPADCALIGISVSDVAEELVPRVVALANAGAELLGSPWRARAEAVQVNDRYLGEGYAVVNEADREAVHLAARLEGLLVDPVYTGRALAGLIDLVQRGEFGRGKRVLFWHTGGAAALAAFADVLL